MSLEYISKLSQILDLWPRRVDNFSWKWTLTSVNEVACSPGQEVKIMSLF